MHDRGVRVKGFNFIFQQYFIFLWQLIILVEKITVPGVKKSPPIVNY